MKIWIIALVALAFLPSAIADCSSKEVFEATYNLCDDSKLYNSDCDFTGDGCVTLPDLVRFAETICWSNCNQEETTTRNSKPTYRASVEELNSGYYKCIFENRMLYFPFDGTQHILRTENYYINEIDLKVSRLGEMALLLGDEVELDLNKDGSNDILLKIAEDYCDEDKIGLSLKYLSEQSVESLPEEEVVEPEIIVEEKTPTIEKSESRSVEPSSNSGSSEPAAVSKEPSNQLTGFVVADQKESGMSLFFKKLFSKF